MLIACLVFDSYFCQIDRRSRWVSHDVVIARNGHYLLRLQIQRRAKRVELADHLLSCPVPPIPARGEISRHHDSGNVMAKG